MINFETTHEDRALIEKITHRAVKLYAEHGVTRDSIDIEMDITATHCNGKPLRLADLLAASDFNFCHDIVGIAEHLDRATGKLNNHFLPRFSA